ncbi:hypothetical protein FH972_002274 [Carpinus fangiana]|uniref:RNase H type-1 domain-containing protein n=1 Tax=Carpinus fangiana TaxID=176857 RepID=A0A5N6QG84_9ROSI|nr:hypothetical protein FH972_002274 [Carpinus fangiana]
MKDANLSCTTYGHIMEDARTLLGTRRSWMIQHVKRTANQVAHGLAKIGVKQ